MFNVDMNQIYMTDIASPILTAKIIQYKHNSLLRNLTESKFALTITASHKLYIYIAIIAISSFSYKLLYSCKL